VRVFLDTSVLLAASGSERGAAREIFRRAAACGWSLLASPYVIDEVLGNLPGLPTAATADWARLRPDLVLVDDILTLDRAAVFEPAKDRPILFSAVAWADVLLTHDRTDFGALLGSAFYGLSILTPGMLLERERAAGRLQG
jgi:predicted nucleic acid-binding protein